MPSATIRSERGMSGLLLQPGREEWVTSARFAFCHGMGGYLFFQSSGLLLPRLARFVAFRPRLNCVFCLKLIKLSPDVELVRIRHRSVTTCRAYALSMAESSALARALALERAALYFSPSERSSAFPSKS